MKRVGFAFFIEIEYERLSIYCNFCKCIRHNLDECKRRTYIEEKHEKTKNSIWIHQNTTSKEKQKHQAGETNPIPKTKHTKVINLTKNKNQHVGQTSGIPKLNVEPNNDPKSNDITPNLDPHIDDQNCVVGQKEQNEDPN